MATLLLRLAAPLQSWGTDSKFETRRTEREPSKSGVMGMLAAALGLRRDQSRELRELTAVLRFGVRVDREGELLRDYHMAHKDKKTSYVTNRYYLSDAVFLVGLESGDRALLERLDDALRHPAFPLFLGRRSCPPTPPLSLGVREEELLDVLHKTPWQVSDWRRKGVPSLRLVTDGAPGESGSGVQRDLPLSFDPTRRNFTDRAVTQRGFITPPDAGAGVTEHDPFAELGGELP